MKDELKAKIALAIISIMLCGIGMGLVMYYSSWQVGAGLFIVIWGNNIINDLVREK